MRRLVLDTSVIIAGLRSRNGASYRLLHRLDGTDIVPLLTTALLLEFEAVLKRPEQRLAHGLSLVDIDPFLAGYAGISDPVNINVSWRPQLRDPDDELVLEAAVNGRADLLVTHNIRDFVPAIKQFGIRVVTPGTLVKDWI